MTNTKRPQTIQGYIVHPAVWDHILAKAEEDKQWALDHEYADNPDAWPGCEMSVDMLRDRLASSVEELARKSYSYFHMRAHARSTGYGGRHIDPAAARQWEELTGAEPLVD